MPLYVHSDRGFSFISTEVKTLYGHGISTSCIIPYNPQGNGKYERYNDILWKPIILALKTQCLLINQWKNMLQQALSSVCALLSIAMNATPLEWLFNYPC